MEKQDWISGKFEETETDYTIEGRNILYKNEIELLASIRLIIRACGSLIQKANELSSKTCVLP